MRKATLKKVEKAVAESKFPMHLIGAYWKRGEPCGSVHTVNSAEEYMSVVEHHGYFDAVIIGGEVIKD